jgi:hypothetical protein
MHGETRLVEIYKKGDVTTHFFCSLKHLDPFVIPSMNFDSISSCEKTFKNILNEN